MAITHAAALRNALADAAVANLDSGSLVLQAASSTAVATLTFGADSYVTATGGIAVSNAITEDASAAGGILALFETQTSLTSAQWAGTITASAGGGDMETTGATITVGAGDTVQCSSLNYQSPS